jgi:hypothetical protein
VGATHSNEKLIDNMSKINQNIQGTYTNYVSKHALVIIEDALKDIKDNRKRQQNYLIKSFDVNESYPAKFFQYDLPDEKTRNIPRHVSLTHSSTDDMARQKVEKIYGRQDWSFNGTLDPEKRCIIYKSLMERIWEKDYKYHSIYPIYISCDVISSDDHDDYVNMKVIIY